MELRNETPMVNNCAQTIMRAYAKDLGITEEIAAGIGCNLGGGMKCGELCSYSARKVYKARWQYMSFVRQSQTSMTEWSIVRNCSAQTLPGVAIRKHIVTG